MCRRKSSSTRFQRRALGALIIVAALATGATSQAARSISFAPSKISFGALAAGQQANRKVRFTFIAGNETAQLTIDGISAPPPFGISDTNSTCHVGMILKPGVTCVVAVTFAPAERGSAAGALTFTAADATDLFDLAIPLHGQGTEKPLKLSSGKLIFRDIPVNSVSTEKFTVSNPNFVPVTLDSISPSNSEFLSILNGCMGEIPAGGACTQDLLFAPTKTGKQKGNLLVRSSVSDRPQSVALLGKGLPATGETPGFSPTLRTLAQGLLLTRYALMMLPIQINFIRNPDMAGSGVCIAMTDGGSYELGFDWPPAPNQPVTAAVYYDNECTRPYIEASMTFQSTAQYDREVSETLTFRGLDGSFLQSQGMNVSFQIVPHHSGQLEDWHFAGLANADGGAQFGVACDIFAPPPLTAFGCKAGVIRNLSALSTEVGWLMNIGLSGDLTAADFMAHATMFLGPLNSLSMNAFAAFSVSEVSISGPSIYDVGNGMEGSSDLSVFAKNFVAGCISENLALVSLLNADQSGSFSGTTNFLTDLVAKFSLDQSGTGSIAFADGSKAPITAWSLGD